MLRGDLYILTLLSFYTFASTAVSWSATPFIPAAIPLAVRSPYLSAWLPQGKGTALNEDWPHFFTGTILGWLGYIRVDGTTYKFLGHDVNVPVSQAIQKNVLITATQSIFSMIAGPVNLTVTFLSPVEPDDLIKQSTPFSYLSVVASSNDGKPHQVQVYSDISAEWLTGNVSSPVIWKTSTGNIITHTAQLAQQVTYGEDGDRSQYGAAYYSTPMANGVTYQTGQDEVVRAQFANNGTLLNTQDTDFRAVSDRWPVFAFAHDLGEIGTPQSDPVVFSVGHLRHPVVQYAPSSGSPPQDRALYALSHFSDIDALIADFHSDFNGALQRANSFDQKIKDDASKISPDYAGLVDVSVRQAFGAIEITVPLLGTGGFNTSDVMIFMKEISSSGAVNTADNIFAAWPLFLYSNATLGKYLLQPLLEYQASGSYPNPWAMHDSGMSRPHYPLALGHSATENLTMPLEETGNMLILALSYTQRSRDKSLITQYFDLLDKWANYLIPNTMSPADQVSTDAFAGSLANQTNLAIKGIIGIKAMSEIASLMGDDARASNYSRIASTYVDQLMPLATASDPKHLTLSYGQDTSWSLTYNLYADKLLGTNIFPSSVYDMQTSWYTSELKQYGLPLDSRQAFTLSGWNIWIAGIVNSTSLRDNLIGAVVSYVSNGKSNKPLPDFYDTITGASKTFTARPVVGGNLALVRFFLYRQRAPGSDSAIVFFKMLVPLSNTSAPPTPSNTVPPSSLPTLPSPSGKSSAVGNLPMQGHSKAHGLIFTFLVCMVFSIV
ncbi:DUF1793-domain-containing protein [Panus rudis PR-1116 ss-1]|nr:DUF1793-domain-containing protein [Panus rudis PR-1116 ss-1]